jgi:signal transduction histidine kinase
MACFTRSCRAEDSAVTSPARRTEAPQTVRRRPGAHAADFAALYATTHDLNLQPDMPALLQTITQRAAKLLGTTVVRVSICGDSTDHSSEESACDEQIHCRHAEFRCAAADNHPFKAILEAPLRCAGEWIGRLATSERAAPNRPLSAADAQLLDLFAAQAASAIHNMQLFEKVRNGRQRMQSLSRQLLHAQENERRLIARELHDQIGQAMTVARMNLQSIDAMEVAPDARTLLNDTLGTIEQVVAQVRDLSLALRPSLLDDFGLPAALKWLVKQHTQRGGLKINLRLEQWETRPPPEIETVCFRVAQEALTNVVRHSQATQARVVLRRNKNVLYMAIRDNGIGFDLYEALKCASGGDSLGLLGMKERAVLAGGRVEIETAPGTGTTVRAYFPMDPNTPYIERRARRRNTK